MDTEQFLNDLESGTIRAATQNSDGTWSANKEVKEGILRVFRQGQNIETSKQTDGAYIGFVEKHNILPRSFLPEDQVRLVPGGSSVRRGAYLGKNIVIMPPAYINIGAYVDDGCLIDSNALVGSCAQVGKNVHVSAGVQIGGVLEPIGNVPVVIEDDVFLGAGCVIVEGINVKKRAVIAPGVMLSKALCLYDMVHETVLAAGSPIPENAVVVSGVRPPKSEWGKDQGLAIQTPVIIKYRDAGSDTSLQLEEALR